MRASAAMERRQKTGVDWDKYRDEVISLYVTQNKTMEETCDHLGRVHGIRPTYANSSDL